MATGFSRSFTGSSDSFKESLALGSEETFDFICNPCQKRNNLKVEAEFYCAVCDDYCCQPCGRIHNSFKGNINHPVYRRDQMDKWGVQVRSAMLPTEVCSDHAEESLKMVCLNHNMLCCTVCTALHHRACHDIVYVPKIAMDIAKSKDLSIVNHTIDQFIQLIDEIIEADKINQTSLEKSQVDFLDNIKEIRRQVNDCFYEFEKSALNEMHIFHDGKTDLLQQHLNSLDDCRDKLTILQTAINPSSSYNESQLLIEIFKANEQLPEYLHTLQKLSQTPQTTNFHLKPNPQLQQLLAKITNLGEMKVNTADMNRKLPKITPLPLFSLKQPSSVETSDVTFIKVQQQKQYEKQQQDQQQKKQEEQQQEQQVEQLQNQQQAQQHKQQEEQQLEHQEEQQQEQQAEKQREQQQNQQEEQKQEQQQNQQQDVQQEDMQEEQQEVQHGEQQQLQQQEEQKQQQQHKQRQHNQQQQIPEQQQQRQQHQRKQSKLYNASKSRNINVKMKSDNKSCYISGSCQMPDGDILLTDKANKKVKRLNAIYKPIDYLNFRVSPNSICCIGNTEAAVTDDNKTIQFLSITRSNLSVTGSLKLDHICKGITHHNGRIILSDNNNKVYIYTTSGLPLKTVQTGTKDADIFSDTRHICMNPDGSKIYVADFHKGLVTLDSEGNHISTYSSGDLRGATDVCVDNQGRILVCGDWSHSVLQLGDWGGLVGQVVGEEDGLEYPESICIDTDRNTLIVAMWELDYIKVFDLK